MSRVCVSTDHEVDTGRLYRRPHAARLASDVGNDTTFSGGSPWPMVFVDEAALDRTWFDGDVSFPPIFTGAPATRRSGIQVGRAGWYLAAATIYWTGVASSTIPYTYLGVGIYKNATPVGQDTVSPSAVLGPMQCCSALVLAQAGDVFTCVIQADTTTALVNGNDLSQPVFSVVWRGGTRLL